MIKILLADDHDVVRRGLRAILEGVDGWTVAGEARDGRAAVKLALELRPDVAIVDYSLPIFNGGEVTRQIRMRLPETEVLIFTMHDSESVFRELLRAGARGYLLKSDADDYLVAAVRAVSQHKPFFSGRVSEAMLQSYLAAGAKDDLLSPRERSIIKLIAEGRTNKDIAELLALSVKTIESHRASILQKLNLSNTADIIRYAICNNIIEGMR